MPSGRRWETIPAELVYFIRVFSPALSVDVRFGWLIVIATVNLRFLQLYRLPIRCEPP